MASYSSTDLIERVRSSIDIHDLVREYVPELKRAGRNFKAACPFHHEKTPSFVVSPEKGMFKCFGCGVGGDIFKFLMNIENLDFKEALYKLSQRAGIDISKYDRAGGFGGASESQKYFKVLEEAKLFYKKKLFSDEGKEARDYLKKRGLTGETAHKFELGLSPRTGSELFEWAAKNGHSSELLQKVGLVVYDQARKRYRDYFWNRIMFPILDSQGRTAAFGARVLDKGEPKFLNSPESPVFHKSRILYGLHSGSHTLRESRTAVILEGYLDVIITHQEGFENTVASMGTALTPEQIKLLRRYVQNIVIAYDPDNAGRMASLRSADLLIESGFFPKIAVFPGGMDADELLLKRGKKEFKGILDDAREVVTFKLDVLLRAIEPRSVGELSLGEKINLVKELLSSLKNVSDTIYRSEAVRIISGRLQLDERSLLVEMGKYTQGASEPGFEGAGQRIKLLSLEEEIINVVFSDPGLVEQCGLSEDDFRETYCKELFRVIAEKGPGAKNSKEFVAAVLSGLKPEISDWATANLLSETERREDPASFLGRLVIELNRLRLREKERSLAEKVGRMLNGIEPRDQKIIDQYRDITKLLRGFGGRDPVTNKKY